MGYVCSFCHNPVDPTDAVNWQRIVGWGRTAGIRASGKQGGSDITLRETQQEWAHDGCIQLEKRALLGQAALL